MNALYVITDHCPSVMSLLMTYLKRPKPSQKVFELTILGVCNRYLKKMAADAGITKNVSFHTSRHTTQVYADVVMETKVEAISRISNYFSNLYNTGGKV